LSSTITRTRSTSPLWIFAEKVVDDATAVIQADIDRLRDLGLSDVELLDVSWPPRGLLFCLEDARCALRAGGCGLTRSSSLSCEKPSRSAGRFRRSEEARIQAGSVGPVAQLVPARLACPRVSLLDYASVRAKAKERDPGDRLNAPVGPGDRAHQSTAARSPATIGRPNRKSAPAWSANAHAAYSPGG